MKKNILFVSFLFVLSFGKAQSLQEKIDRAVKVLQADAQMKHAILSLYVVETKTGIPVFELNKEVGLVPASTQKIFTSIASFELLGKYYHYKTEIGYEGNIEKDTLKGNLVIKGSGDPTLGSWRYAVTKPEVLTSILLKALQKESVKYIRGNIIIDGSKFTYQPIPGGWVWDDIGNYYGAGTWALNWNENQYDLLVVPGNKEGEEVKITATKPALENFKIINFLKTGKPGSGDNGYIYMPPYATNGFVTGTVPAGEKEFVLAGAIPDPPFQFGIFIKKYLIENDILISGNVTNQINNDSLTKSTFHSLAIIESPIFDSINYCFIQKSINLYGEALIKSFAFEKEGIGSTENGVSILKLFWQKNGIDSSAINIIDGSGLSPQNRVSTKALVDALQYATTKNWYENFYNALPFYNGIKMKSGTIGGSKAFAGYYTSQNNIHYTFAIILNNFAKEGSIVPKLYKVLDQLK
ncbi:MAG: D-alanyl-D-alanine carboxypeptidase/D-alanyl-D-alanine-endopeptidase [Ferruginibacter sp.]